MTSIKIEVVKYLHRWQVRIDVDHGREGYEEIRHYRTKFQAVLVARFRARILTREHNVPVEVIYKTEIGKIADKNTHGYDPESSQG